MKYTKSGLKFGFGLVIGQWLGRQVIRLADSAGKKVIDMCENHGIDLSRYGVIKKNNSVMNKIGFYED